MIFRTKPKVTTLSVSSNPVQTIYKVAKQAPFLFSGCGSCLFGRPETICSRFNKKVQTKTFKEPKDLCHSWRPVWPVMEYKL